MRKRNFGYHASPLSSLAHLSDFLSSCVRRHATGRPKSSQLIADGKFAEAEKLLQPSVADPDAPVTSEAAIQLEVLRRTRHDFPLTNERSPGGNQEERAGRHASTMSTAGEKPAICSPA